MRRIRLAVVLVIGLTLSSLAVEAQQAGKVYRIGVIWFGPEPSTPPGFEVFRQSLRESGYVEGTNLSFLHRWSERRPERLSDLATDLVRLKVDVLLAWGTLAIRAMTEATTTVPIVIISVADPVDSGLITSLARPGGNITGVSGRVEELNEKLLELLKESKPSASRVAVFGHPTAVGLHREGMEVASRSLGVRLQFLKVTSLAELDAAFEAAAKGRAEGLVLLPTVLFAFNERWIAGLALRRQVPTIFWRSEFAEAGGLMAYGPDAAYLWRRAGWLAASILKGARPADLPVEQADRFRLVINLKTAKALGLTIPQTLLLRADQVIE
jgi:putative tryptophan/tyrosine transport system substrate-binding protein